MAKISKTHHVTKNGTVKKNPSVDLYSKHKNMIQKDIDNFPIVFAFSNEQLEEGLRKLKSKREDVLSIGGGGIIRKSDKHEFLEMLKRHDREHKELLKNPDYVYSMFRYELANHEYCITYDYEDTLSACGLKMADIERNPMFQKQLEKATRDYLKNAGEC